MTSMTLCLTVAEGMTPDDRDDLIARVDAYVESGIDAERAQLMAANDLLADILADRVELDRLAREQHPDVFGRPEPEPAAVEFAELGPEQPLYSRADTVSTGRIRRTIDELMDAALSMENWKDWYDRHEDKMVQAFGSDAPLMKRLLSITSQAATVQSNFALALKAYDQWYSLAPFEGYLPGVAANLRRLRAGEDIRGPKIEQYERAVAGYSGGIAVDRHIAQLMFNTDKPNGAQRKAAMRRVVDIAEALGWSPREVQSALWAYNQVRKGTDPNEVASYATLIDRHAEAIFKLTLGAGFARREAGGFRAFRDTAARVAAGAEPARRGASVLAGSPDRREGVGTRRPLRVTADSGRARAGIAEVAAFDLNGDPIGPEPDGPLLYSRAGQFTLSDFGIWPRTVEAVQDRYNRWKQAVTQVAEQGGRVTEANDFYRAEERYWGKVGSQVEDFRGEVERFVKDVTKDGLDLGAVALYAYAQHAPERNAYIAAKRPGMPDGGSGMSNAQAAQIIAEAQRLGIDAKLQRHTATMRSWIAGTRELLHDEGLIDDTEYLEWVGGVVGDHYVPLKGLEGFEAKRGVGQGFNVRGKESREAKGRRSAARNIIEQIIEDRTRAQIRAGKNEVLRSFAQFVIDNPSPNLWEVSAVSRKPVTKVDPNTGDRIIDEKWTIVSDDRTVTVKDGGQEIHILVRDEKLREQLQGLNNEAPGRVVGAFLWANRMLSRLYTSLSPVFVAVNALRDVQTATIGTIDELGFLGAAKLYQRLPGAMLAAWRAEVGKNPSPAYQLYRTTGGKTGFMDFKTIDDRAAELKAMAAAAERSALDPRTFGPKALELIESINGAVENSIRFATFEAARASGQSVAGAASIAKNVTVNFNRRGSITPALSAWFLFFNPAVQGTARVAQALANPKVLATLGAGMAGVAALALRNASMGDDDDGVAWWDKVPNEVKERNIVIVLPPGASEGEPVPGSKVGRYVKIPMPYGYNFFAAVANQFVDVWRHSEDPARGRGMTEAGVKLYQAFAGAWLPVSELGRAVDTSESAVLAVIPDAFSPIAQNLMNLSTFGTPMYPSGPNTRDAPDSSLYFASDAGTIFQQAAARMNELTGGNGYRGGWIDVTPASLENIARGYGGGPAAFALDMLNAVYARQSIERDSLDVRRLPFVKQLYGQIDAETDRVVSGERMREVREVYAPFERAKRDGKGEVMQQMLAEHGPMIRAGEALKDFDKAMGEFRKQELALIASDQPESVKYVGLQTLAAKRRGMLQQFNILYSNALREKVSPETTPP